MALNNFTCRLANYGTFPMQKFQQWACSYCYFYLEITFNRESRYVPVELLERMNDPHNGSQVEGPLSPIVGHYLVDVNEFDSPANMSYYEPDPYKSSVIVNSLNKNELDKWKACCKAASKCCDDMNLEPKFSLFSSLANATTYCPKTWDGWACIPETAAGETTKLFCPNYIYLQEGYLDGSATKSCLPNGSWFRDDVTGREYTDYYSCLNTNTLKQIAIIASAGYIISLLSLIIALSIFYCCRSVRKKLMKTDLVRVHKQFFLSLTLTCIWAMIGKVNDFVGTMQGTMQVTNVFQSKPALYNFYRIFMWYIRGSNFCWMFCEALFFYLMLYRVHHTRKFFFFVLFGWGFPIIPVTILSIVKNLSNSILHNSWNDAGNTEWIVFAPNLLMICLNAIFLTLIIRMLRKKVRDTDCAIHRRAVRAVIMLLPLFGVNFLLFAIIHESFANHFGSLLLDILQYTIAVMESLQGFFVTIFFCFTNNEVIEGIRDTIIRYRRKREARLLNQMQQRPRQHSMYSSETTLGNCVKHNLELPDMLSTNESSCDSDVYKAAREDELETFIRHLSQQEAPFDHLRETNL